VLEKYGLLAREIDRGYALPGKTALEMARYRARGHAATGTTRLRRVVVVSLRLGGADAVSAEVAKLAARIMYDLTVSSQTPSQRG
jgi:hypothetical protein